MEFIKRFLKKLVEFITDPSSGQLSMSRFCMGILILIFIPIYFYLRYKKIDVDSKVIIACVASVASVYGLNSLAGPITKVINKIRSDEGNSGVTIKTTVNNETEKGEA